MYSYSNRIFNLNLYYHNKQNRSNYCLAADTGGRVLTAELLSLRLQGGTEHGHGIGHEGIDVAAAALLSHAVGISLEEGNDISNSGLSGDDSGDTGDSTDTFLAGGLTDQLVDLLAHSKLSADAAGLKEDGVHGCSNISPVSLNSLHASSWVRGSGTDNIVEHADLDSNGLGAQEVRLHVAGEGEAVIAGGFSPGDTDNGKESKSKVGVHGCCDDSR